MRKRNSKKYFEDSQSSKIDYGNFEHQSRYHNMQQRLRNSKNNHPKSIEYINLREKRISDIRISKKTLRSKNFKIVVSSIIDIIIAKLDDKLENIEYLAKKNLRNFHYVKKETEKIENILLKDRNSEKFNPNVQLFNCDKRFFHKLFNSKKIKNGPSVSKKRKSSIRNKKSKVETKKISIRSRTKKNYSPSKKQPRE